MAVDASAARPDPAEGPGGSGGIRRERCRAEPSVPGLIAYPALHVLTSDSRDHLVPAHADQPVQPPHRIGLAHRARYQASALIVGIDERPVNVKDGNGGVCHSWALPANPVPNRAVIRKGQATGHRPIRIGTGRRRGHTAHAKIEGGAGYSRADRPIFRVHDRYNRRSSYRTSSPVIVRPISIRWISDVPSKMVKIFASRCQRSTGYSRV
jgi:hypothetical protein